MKTSRHIVFSTKLSFVLFFVIFTLLFSIAFIVNIQVILAQEDDTTPLPPELVPVVQEALPSISLKGLSITPSQLHVGEKANLSFSIAGTLLPGCFGTPLRPVDAVVVIDTSPSAGKPVEGSNLWQSEQIIKSMWLQMDQPVCQTPDLNECEPSRLGLVTIDIGTTGAEIHARLPLTSTKDAIFNAVDALDNGADSSFDLGIKRASEILDKEGREEAEKVIVLLLHDRFFASDETIIETAREVGGKYPLIVIGNTLNLREEEKLVKEVAEQLTTSSHIYINPSAEDLRHFFVRASGGDADIVGKAIHVGATFSPPEIVNLWSDDGKVGNGRVDWYQDIMKKGEMRQFQSDIKVQEDGNFSELVVGGDIQYLDCNGWIFDGSNIEKRVSIGRPSQSTQPPGPTATPTPKSSSAPPTSHPATVELPDSSHGSSTNGKFSIPWKFIFPLFIFLILVLLYWLLCKMEVIPWCKSRTIPKNISRPPVNTTSEGKKIEWKPPVSEDGVDIEPGRKTDDTEIRKKLFEATTITGRIPTDKTGKSSSSVELDVLTDSKSLQRSSFDLMKMSQFSNTNVKYDVFEWDTKDDGIIEVPIGLLWEVLQKRVSPDTPLAVFWTTDPTDHSELQIKITPFPKYISVSGRRKYKSDLEGKKPIQSFFIAMKFINNPQHLGIKKGAIIDN